MSHPSGARGAPGLSPAARRRFKEIADVLADHEPQLELHLDVDRATIRGPLEIPRGAGLTENVHVELRFVGRDPFRVPEAWDAQRRFEPIPDRHLEDHGPSGWRFCLWISAEERVTLERAEHIILYLEELKEHLRKQFIYEERKRAGAPKPWWPGPEWKHGNLGLAEWVLEVLDEPDFVTVERLFPYFADRPLSFNKSCPCGSGVRAGECHRDSVLRIRKASSTIPVRELLPAIRMIFEEREQDGRRSESA